MSDIHLKVLQHSCGLSRVVDADAPADGSNGLAQAARLITGGAFLQAVKSVPTLRSLLDCSSETNVVHDAASYYDLVGRRAAAAVEAALAAGAAEPPPAVAAPAAGARGAGAAALDLEAVLLAATACLHLFGQFNLTGPSYVGPPPSPLDLFAPGDVAAHWAKAPPRPPPAVAAAAIAAIAGEPTPSATNSETAAATAASEPSAPSSETTPSAASADGLCGLGVDSVSRGDRWAQQRLQLDGEDLVGRCPAVQWLLLARLLLLTPLAAPPPPPPDAAATPPPPPPPTPNPTPTSTAPLGHDPAPEEAPTAPSATPLPGLPALLRCSSRGGSLPWCWSWWALRCVLSQQHLLEGRAHSLLSEASQLIQVLVAPDCPWAHPPPPPAIKTAAPQERPTGQSTAAALGGVLHVELALCQYLYGYVDAGRQYIVRAGQLLGLEPQVTGALGKRTVHQVDPKAQLVVVASERLRAVPPSEPCEGERPVEELGLGGSASAANLELEGLRDDSDVLTAPLLVGAAGQQLETRYSPPEQALLLAWATAVKKATSADDLQEWQMAPWVEAVLSQPRAVFMTAAAARLNKTRHERSRGRTRERALLAMDQLAEAVTGKPPPPPPPPVTTPEATPPTLAEEGAEAGREEKGEGAEAGAGVAASSAPASVCSEADLVSEAGRRAVLSWAVWFPLQVQLRREAAEHYVSMGLVGAAIRVFESLELWDAALTCYRLIGKKALAEELIRRRLCVTPDDPRLWCALGDLHLDDRYYEEAWRRSGQRHSRSQRSLARSAMRRKDYPKAAVHWQAALALNPLHPEAWFSLGFCHLKTDRHREALRAFTRVTQQEPDNGEAWNNIAALWMHLGGYRPAFAALSESVRHKRDSWQTWENYARAALASGHYQQAVRGLQMSLRLSSGQRLFLDVAVGLLDVLEGKPPARDGGTSLAAAAAAAAEGLRGVAAERAEGAADASLQEDEAALGVPLLPLLADMPLRNPQQDDDHTDADGAAAASAAAASAASAPPTASSPGLLSGREREVVIGGVGSLLREAINRPVASAGLWGCLARYWELRGEAESAKEARIKQVRGLAGGAFKSDPERFKEYAEASEALGRAYLEAFRGGKTGGLKDLAAGRMQLRGLLRATAENFGDHPVTVRLQALLDEITRTEDAALAASRAAAQG